MKNLTIKTKIIVFVSVIILIMGIIFTIISITKLEHVAYQQIDKFKTECYITREKELKNLVELAITIMSDYEGKENGKKDALKKIKKLRYGQTGYFWIQNRNVKMEIFIGFMLLYFQ